MNVISNLPTPGKHKLKAKEECVKVFCRVRPKTAEERSRQVTTCIGVNTKEQKIELKKAGGQQFNYTFDKVFGPKTSQDEIYHECVAPLIDEACEGYSCTLFAYGQTGTGKTYTLEGTRDPPKPASELPEFKRTNSATRWSIDQEIGKSAGIIPRSMVYLLQKLKKLPASQQYSVEIRIVELYNEKLIDLLGNSNDMEAESREIKLMEQTNGEACLTNVQSKVVKTKEDVMKLIEQASSRRQTAATKMNAQSSRSHCIFQAEISIEHDGGACTKIGKLFLVDLAGSENIGRSGATDKRAKEAGNINKSLLVLGRVINSLVDRSKHVPYRDSILTRLLKASLGGKCKTTMINCISPCKTDYDETHETLKYGYRAKGIKNKPEVSETKNMSMINYDLQRRLENQQKRDGVYIPKEEFEDLMFCKENNQELEQQNEELEEQLEKKVEEYDDLLNQFNITKYWWWLGEIV